MICNKSGQSLIETCLVVIMTCFIFCGVFQISQIFSAKEILEYAASRAARAKTVGFNKSMVTKAGKVGGIPVAGKMTYPSFTNIDLELQTKVSTLKSGDLWDWVLEEADPSSSQYEIEKSYIPEYLGSDFYVLDYEMWGTLTISESSVGSPFSIIHTTAKQRYPLTVPMHRAFYDEDYVDLISDSYIEKHYSLYLEDMGW